MIQKIVSQEKLEKILSDFKNEYIGFDSSIKDTRHEGLKIVQTTDCFYPLVEDPYLMGKITCSNVLSDLYAMGVTECDNMLMILGVSEKLEDEIRDIVLKKIIQGFHDHANEAGTIVTGGQTIRNPWFLLGGVATGIVKESEMIRPVSAVPGDVLVLTKPLGTRVAVNAHVMLYNKEKEKKLLEIFSKEEIISLYNSSIDSMVRLNRKAAQLMHKYKAHAATDVTGFGILGHANQLASNQKACVKFEIHTLPCFANALRVNDVFDYGLKTGYSAETSGGLLISISRENAPMLIKELHELEGWPAFVVGEVFERVSDSEPYAYLSNEPLFVEVMDPHA